MSKQLRKNKPAKRFGKLLGLVRYFTLDGWVGIEDKTGRIDEYRENTLEAA